MHWGSLLIDYVNIIYKSHI